VTNGWKLNALLGKGKKRKSMEKGKGNCFTQDSEKGKKNHKRWGMFYGRRSVRGKSSRKVQIIPVAGHQDELLAEGGKKGGDAEGGEAM